MKWRRLLLVACLILVGILLGRRLTTEPHAQAKSKGAPHSAKLTWQGLPKATKIPAIPPPESAPSDAIPSGEPIPDPPTELEAGTWKEYYERWMRGGQDRPATRDAIVYLDDLLDQYRIEPNRRLLSCSPSICRAQLSFSTLQEMRDLTRIPYDTARVHVGQPEPVEDGVTIVFYWDREDSDSDPDSESEGT